MKYEFLVPDMTCEHCVKKIEDAIHAIAPEAAISADTTTHWLTITNVEDSQSMLMAMQRVGFSPRWI